MLSFPRSTYIKAHIKELAMQTGEKLKLKDAPQTERPARRWPWLELAVLLGYFGLTLALTWPLALNFTTSVPNGPSEDRFQNLWNFWWIERALAHFQNPYETNILFYPYYTGGTNPILPLYLHALQLLNGLVVLPLSATLGVTAAYNGLIFFSFSLSGLGTFLLGRHLTRNFWAGLLAGLLYTFSVPHFGSVNSSITNIMSIQWLPFYALGLHLWHERRSLKWAALAAVFLALVIYTDWYNTIFVVFYTVFFFLVTGWPRHWLKQLPGVAVALLGGSLLGAFAVIPTFLTLSNPIIAAQLDLNRDIRSSSTLFDVINLQELDGLLFWIGLVVGLGLILSGGIWRKAGSYWLAFYLLCYLFTLGPRLQIERVGDPTPTDIPLPYALVKLVPGASIMRSPDRFDIPGQLALALLLAFGFARLTGYLSTTLNQKLKTKSQCQKAGINILLCLVIALPYLLRVNPAPLNLIPVAPASFVNFLPKTGEYNLLELPITRHYNFDHERMLNQIYHQQPIMGGYLSRPVYDPYRETASPFRYFADQSYLYAGDPNREIFPAQYNFALVDNLIKLYNFRYVVIYKEDYRFERERQSVRELIEKQIGQDAIIQEDGHTILYKVPDSFWQRPAITPALFVGEGWYKVEQNADGLYRWTNQQSNLYITVAQPTHLKLSLTALAFGGDRTLRLSANSQQIFESRITPAPQPLEVEFDVNPGTTRLHLESLSPAQTAQETGLGQDTRPLAFLVREVKLQSTG